MNDEGGQDLDDREDADPENDLLDEIALLDDGHGCRRYAFGQEEPGDHAGYDPENEREVRNGRGFESNLEHEPQYQYCDTRLNEGPYEPQRRPKIPGLEIVLRQFQNDMPAVDEIAQKEEELFQDGPCTR